MIRISSTQLWVHDQDAALGFYTGTLGMEVRQDVSLDVMGGFRWLTVGWPGQPEVNIVLMPLPRPPVADAATGATIADLVSRGFGGAVFMTVDDCRATHRELTDRGVAFIGEPEQTPYGIDAGFHDPSGNVIRLTQVLPPYSGS